MLQDDKSVIVVLARTGAGCSIMQMQLVLDLSRLPYHPRPCAPLSLFLSHFPYQLRAGYPKLCLMRPVNAHTVLAFASSGANMLLLGHFRVVNDNECSGCLTVSCAVHSLRGIVM